MKVKKNLTKKEKKAFGIIDQCIIEASEFAIVTSAALKDGKVTLGEGWEMGSELIDLKIVYKNWDEVKEAWKNKTSEDIQRWENILISHFGVGGEDAQKIAYHSIKIASHFIELGTVVF